MNRQRAFVCAALESNRLWSEVLRHLRTDETRAFAPVHSRYFPRLKKCSVRKTVIA
jgi:hypothetical protein